MTSLALCPHSLKTNLCIQCKKYKLDHRRIESKNAFDPEIGKDEDNESKNEMISIDMDALPINMNALPIEICFSFNTSTGIGFLLCVRNVAELCFVFKQKKPNRFIEWLLI